MYGIILHLGTVAIPLAALYVYQRHVAKQPYKIVRNDILVPLGAAILQFCASHVPYFFLDQMPANFLHHAIGGGVAVAIIALYFQKRVWPGKPLWIQALFVLAAVNILGNVNEIAELAAELITNVTYISSKLDTNIDLVANNLGGLVGFGAVLGVRYIVKKVKA